MPGDIFRKTKPKFSIANEKLVHNAKKLQSRPYTEIFKKFVPSMFKYPKT